MKYQAKCFSLNLQRKVNMAIFSTKKANDQSTENNEDEKEKKPGLRLLILKGIGRVIFSQGFFVIIIIILTAFICNKAKEKNANKDQQAVEKNENKKGDNQ